MTPRPGQPELLTQVSSATRDEPTQRPLSMGLILRLWRLTEPHRATRTWLLLLTAIRGLQVPALALTAAAVLKGPIAQRDWPGTVWGGVGFFALALLTAGTFHFRARLGMSLGEAVVFDLRRMIFEHLQRLSMRFYDRTRVGWILSRVTSDVEALRNGVQNVFFVTVVQGVVMVAAAAVMLVYDPALFAVLLAMAPGLFFINRYFHRRLGDAYRAVQESMSRVTATLAESVSGIRVTQGFVRQDVNAQLFGGLIADHSRHNLGAARLTGVFLPLLEFNRGLFTAVLLVIGGYQVLFGSDVPRERFDDLVVFLFMANHFFGPLTSIGRLYDQALTAMAGAERVFKLLDTEPEPLEPPDAPPLGPITGHVVFDEVSFGYDPARPVLHDVSFAAEPGQTIALVGQTGSGKTTVINLIAKFYLPTAGRVLVDGHDTAGVQSESLMQQLGIVLQQNFLFSGTVLDNIRVGKNDATEDQVVEVAERLNCLDLFEAMPDGFATDVGEKGQGLSLGQRQLVCFARAMLADPRILILDEATSSVDTMTEARIQRALEVLLAGRTSFVVAHRLSTIRHADTVLVLDHGRIVERGSHNQLLAVGGVYANLYRQFVRAGEA